MKKKLCILVMISILLSVFSVLTAIGSYAYVNGVRPQYEWEIPKVNNHNPKIVFDGTVDLEGEWKGALCVPLDASKDSKTYEEITLWSPAVWTNGAYDFASFDEMDDAFKITINTYYLWDETGLYIASVCNDMVAYNGVYDFSEYIKNRDGNYGYADTYEYAGMYGHSWEPMFYYSDNDNSISGYHWPYFFIGCGEGVDAWMDYDVTSNGNWANTAYTAEKGNPDKDHSIAKKIRSVSTVSEPTAKEYGSWNLEIYLPWEYLNAGVDENGNLYQKAHLGYVGSKFRIGSIYGIRDTDIETESNAGIRVRMSQTQGWGNPDFFTLSGSTAESVPSHVDGNKSQKDYTVPKINPWNPEIEFDGVVDLEGEWYGAECVSIDMSMTNDLYKEVTIWPQGVWNGDFRVGSYDDLDPKWRMTINTYFLWDEEGLYIATKCDDCRVYNGLYNAEEYINYLSGRTDSYNGDLGFHFEPMIVATAAKDAYLADPGGHWPNFFIGTTNDGEACWKDNDVVSDSADPNPNELTQKIKHAQILNAGSSFSQEIFLPWDYINADAIDGVLEKVGNLGTAGTTFRAGLIYSVRSDDPEQPRIKFSNAKGWANYDAYTLSAASAQTSANAVVPEASDFVAEESKDVVHSVVESGSTEQPVAEIFLTKEELAVVEAAKESSGVENTEVSVVLNVTAEEKNANSDNEEVKAEIAEKEAQIQENFGENFSSPAMIDVNITKEVIVNNQSLNEVASDVTVLEQPVTVTVKVPAEVNASDIVAVVNTDNNYDSCPFDVVEINSEPYVSFTTSHFSTFAFVQRNHIFDNTQWGYREEDGHAHMCTEHNCNEHDDIILHVDDDSNGFCDDCDFDLRCKHLNKTYHPAVRATCFDSGNIEYWSCDDCDIKLNGSNEEISDSDVIDPVKGHNWKNVNGKAATCKEIGWKSYFKCGNTDCGQYSYSEDDSGFILINDLESWKSTDGRIEKTPHEFTEEIKDEAHLNKENLPENCEDNYIYFYDCANCDEIATSENFTFSGDVLGHDYSEEIKDERHLRKEATNCLEKTSYWYNCSRCESNAGVDETALDKWYETDETGDHQYDEENWGYKGKDGHAHKCTLCGEPDDVIEHTPNIEEATEEQDKVCTECGYIIETKVHVHVSEVVKGYMSTCVTTGLTDGSKCSECGMMLVEQRVIPMVAHERGLTVVENISFATPYYPGSYDFVGYCVNCSAELDRRTIVVPYSEPLTPAIPEFPETPDVEPEAPHVHNYEDIDGYDSTCTETGLTDGVVCSDCGEYLIIPEIIPANGHTYSAFVVENLIEATAATEGSYDLVSDCLVCGEELARVEIVLPATGVENPDTADDEKTSVSVLILSFVMVLVISVAMSVKNYFKLK